MSSDFSSDFSDFRWHSSIGLDLELGGRHLVSRLANTREARSMFVKASDNRLIHKTTQALWKFSEDGKSIVPEHATDILTDEDCRAVMGEEQQ